MKNQSSFIKFMLVSISLFTYAGIMAQQSLSKIGIVKIESRGWNEEQPFTQLVRIELSKLNLYEVLDRYDIEDNMKRNKINIETCLNKDCILEAGKSLGAEYMLSGSIEHMGTKVLLMFRVLEVSSSNTIKTITKEFPDDRIAPGVLIEVSLKEMYDIKIEDVNKQNLDKKNGITNAVQNSVESTVSIGGPRFGFAILTGTAAEFVKRPKSDGGYGGYPAMFQFGYQFEKMYLNEGNLQALFEFIPSISGVDQGHFIPSFTILNGFRSTANGLEFAFGPTITWTKTVDQYQDQNGNWIYESRNDSRGTPTAKPGVLIAVGKTFKSGKLNMPLNFYVIPRIHSFQYGVSYGFNAMKKKK
jgi:hypothetical protein